MAIQKCGVITVPYDKQCQSGNFGLPNRGDLLRNGVTPSAILIRCIGEGYAEPCYILGNLKKESEAYRESYHFIIKADGTVVAEVPLTETSWALHPFYDLGDDCNTTDPQITYPECGCIDWTPINGAIPVNTYKDDRLITIAVESPRNAPGGYNLSSWAHKSCGCSNVTLHQNFSTWQLYKLARLMSWLFLQFPTIPKTTAGIEFFQNINECEITECGCTPSVSELVCLATNYCEPIKNMAGGFVAEGEVAYIYGFDSDGLPVKEAVSDFLFRTLVWDVSAGRPEILLPSLLFKPLDTKP